MVVPVAMSRLLLELVVTSKSIVRVLTALKDRAVTAQDVQAWASFVRRGYVAGMTNQPVKPLTIEYEQLYEDAIVEIIDRLDQLGDLIDGTIDETMLDTMIAKVSRPTVR